jgi:superfamily II DNA or RNA helicase
MVVKCSAKKPCPKPFVCDPVEKICVRRNSTAGKAVVAGLNQPLLDTPRKKKRVPWKASMVQGSIGFNAYATKNMVESGLTSSQFNIACQQGRKVSLHAYQRVVDFLIHPKVPIDRFLVLHRVGAGKTWTMIRMLDNYFSDPRPKVVIFPNEKVVRGFYVSLMVFPNKYRSYITKQTGWKDETDLLDARGKIDLAKLEKVVSILEMGRDIQRAGTAGYMKAPLKAFRFTIAGGSTVIRSGEPTNSGLFKHYYDGKNPYNNKIILMDEYHNLLKPKEDVKQFAHKLTSLRKALKTCAGSVVVGLTATPVSDNPQDAADMLLEIKGDKYKNSPTNEGFISYFQSLPSSIYPIVFPGPPDDVFPLVNEVTLQGENLIAYDKQIKLKKSMYKLQNYGNMASWYGFRADFVQKLSQHPYSYATKLTVVAKDILADKRKTLVIMHRENGFRALQQILVAQAGKTQNPCPSDCWFSLYDKPTQEDEILLAQFNAPENSDGHQLHIALVDAKFYSEGVDFKSVRRVILVDIPSSYADYVQRIGRVLRSCVYQKQLPLAERNVSVELFIATHPNPDVETADQFYLRKLKSEHFAIGQALKALENLSVDKAVLAPLLQTAEYGVSPPNKKHEIPEGSVPSRPSKAKSAKTTVQDLKDLCRKNGVKGFSNKNREWLVQNCQAKV